MLNADDKKTMHNQQTTQSCSIVNLFSRPKSPKLALHGAHEKFKFPAQNPPLACSAWWRESGWQAAGAAWPTSFSVIGGRTNDASRSPSDRTRSPARACSRGASRCHALRLRQTHVLHINYKIFFLSGNHLSWACCTTKSRDSIF